MKIAEVDAALVSRLCADMAARGNNVLRALRAEGASISEVIKATRVAFGISLGEAKELVSQHEAWVPLASQSVALQDEAAAAFEAVVLSCDTSPEIRPKTALSSHE